MRAVASASDPAAEEAASRILKLGGTAGEALIAGFLCAAAARPGVLLAPLQALLAGPGVGVRAIEGRSRQPGLGVPRPRGVVEGQPTPGAAYVATPASIAALSVLHAHDGNLSFGRLAEPGVEYAQALGATERTAVIRRIGQAGPSALREAAMMRPLLAVGGRAEGGVLSEDDLAAVRPVISSPRERALSGDHKVLLLPWPQPQESGRVAEVIVAVDARGVLAALAYVPDEEGLSVPELGLTLPREAVVVRRGIPRVPPGEALPCPAPVAIALSAARPFLALGVRSPTPLDEGRLVAGWADVTAPAGQWVRLAREAANGSSGYAVMRALTGEEAFKVSALDAV